jgi:short-chain fatty acids transporter
VIERLGASFATWAERWVPSPFFLALALTVVTFVLAVGVTGAGPYAVLVGWGEGFWGFLAFGMQMSLVLVTGYALAMSGVFRRVVDLLADLPKGTRSAVGLTGLVSVIVSLVHWGLGLIVGALLAREIGRSAARRGLAIHYPLVVAAAYAGFLSWHGGLSGSAPLTVATPGHFLEESIGVVGVERTLMSPLNLVVSALLVVAVPLLLMGMSPRGGGRGAPAELLDEDGPVAEPPSDTPSGRLERSRAVGSVVAVAGLVFVVGRFWTQGFSALDFNLVNFSFLFLGLLLWGSPAAYSRAVGDGVRGAAGIILQFPFYAGILGMMKSTGLLVRFAELGASAGKGFFLVTTFLAAGVVNLFVPSGGGQWGVQGPVVVEAAARLGIPVERAIMAVAYGDEWTNMLQPFWALALLGVTRLAARDIVGYTALVMLMTGPLYIGALLLV